jgi:hypothetical protein
MIIEKLKCNKCGKVAGGSNHYQEAWIKVDGEISKGTGKYNKKRSSYDSQWINAREKTYHFCSWKCLEGYTDNK